MKRIPKHAFYYLILMLVFGLTSAAFEVKVIYFQPTDSRDRSEWLGLDSIMKSIQNTNRSEMERHGFSGKILDWRRIEMEK